MHLGVMCGQYMKYRPKTRISRRWDLASLLICYAGFWPVVTEIFALVGLFEWQLYSQ